jgi:hypothetical protein
MSNPAIVNAAILSAASAEFVHHFLKERAAEAGRAGISGTFTTPPAALPDDYERTLLERKERLIDLALALYGYDESVVQELFFRNPQDTALRSAALSNQAALAPFLNSAAEEEVESLFINPELDFRFVRAFFSREAPFNDLNSDRLMMAVRALIRNPKFFAYRGFFIHHPREQHYEKIDDPETEYDYRSAIKALLALSRDMPVNALWARHLVRLYEKLSLGFCRWDEALKAAERWIEPGTSARDHDASFNDIGYLNEWQRVRFHLGRMAICHSKEKIADLFGHEDIAFRAAAYSMMEATLENIDLAFERDGVVCFDTFFQNPKLWQAASHRSLMDDLARRADQQSNNIDYIISMRSSLSKFLEQLEKDHPEWFAEEQIEDLNQEDEEATRQAEGEARRDFEFSQLEKLSELTRAQRQTSHRVAILIGLVICCMVYFFAF